MLTYCVKQRRQTECVPGSETFLVTKNGRKAVRCQCAECGITKFRFLSKREGSGFDELIVKGLAAGTKGLFNLGRMRASKAIKSDFTKKKMKEVGEKYLGQVIDSVTDDLSKRIDPRTGGRVDIHKAIGKLPRPKRGWTLPGHKYTGPYNDLEKQLKYDPGTGEILEIYDQPTGTADAIAMQHDVIIIVNTASSNEFPILVFKPFGLNFICLTIRNLYVVLLIGNTITLMSF